MWCSTVRFLWITWVSLLSSSSVHRSRDQNIFYGCKSKTSEFRHDGCVERRPFGRDEEVTGWNLFCFFHHRCVSLISAITWLALCNACRQTFIKKCFNEVINKEPYTRENLSTGRREPVTCSMSAASLRRWAMSSDSVSRSLRRPDLYSWPTSSLWRLSFTWLTRKCITAFGTLPQTEKGRKQTKQMVENKVARWCGDGIVSPDGGARLCPTRWPRLSKYWAV